jgi:excinuclease ABC subunit A
MIRIYRKVKPFRTLVILHWATSTTLSVVKRNIKLAGELSKKIPKYVLYLDEPTTGLHFEDIRVMVINKLVKGIRY